MWNHQIRVIGCCLGIVCGVAMNGAAVHGHGGYPPWGAWAYGSHWSSLNVYSGWGHHHGWFPRSSWVARSAWYPRSTWLSVGWSVPVVRSAYYYQPAVCFRPTIHYRPSTIHYYYSLPTWCPPTDCLNPTVPSYPVSYPISDYGVGNYEVGTSGYQVSTRDPGVVVDAEPPHELLQAADAILQAGGYRQAATAYAKLQVRYGSSGALFARRYVAQILAGDWAQAGVVLASADAVGYRIDPTALPAASLAALIDVDQAALEQTTEQLAAQALAAPHDAEAMKLIGVWLRLTGDESRSALCLSLAQRLENSPPTELGAPTVQSELAPQMAAEELPPPRSTPAFVTLE